MSGSKQLVRSFRLVSAVVYLLDLFVCMHYGSRPIYLNLLIGTLCSMCITIMLIVAVNGPPVAIRYLDTKRFAFLFTFRGRYLIDLLVSLFMFAMGWIGILMAMTTLTLIFGIRFAGVKHPQAFGELFRQTADALLEDDNDTYTEGDEATIDNATYEGSTIESGMR